VKQVKPNASFQIRTPTGVAGVVGTDFALDSQGDTTRIVVYEGKVNFCAYKSKKKEEQEGAQGGAASEAAGAGGEDQQKEKNRRMLGPCVIVGAGETSSVQFNAAPTPPVPATPVTVTEMSSTTSVSGGGGGGGDGGGCGCSFGDQDADLFVAGGRGACCADGELHGDCERHYREGAGAAALMFLQRRLGLATGNFSC
jgi:hypothetical protein